MKLVNVNVVMEQLSIDFPSLDTQNKLMESLDKVSVVCDLEVIKKEIQEAVELYVCDKEENTMKAQGMCNALSIVEEVFDKYIGDKKNETM